MSAHTEGQLIPALDIPEILRGAPKSAYSKEHSVIILGEDGGKNTEGLILEVLQSFPKLSVSVDHRQQLSSWLDELPESMRQHVITYDTRSGNFIEAYMPVSVAIKLLELTMAKAGTWKWIKSKFGMESLVRDLKDEIELKRTAIELPKPLKEKVQKARRIIWDLVDASLQENEDFSDRIELHERIHLLDANRSLGEIPGEWYNYTNDNIINKALANRRRASDPEIAKKNEVVDRYFRSRMLYSSATEANAILHEILGQSVLQDTDDYSHLRFVYRMPATLGLFAYFYGSTRSGLQSTAELKSTGVTLDGYPLEATHQLGTIFALLSDEIDFEATVEGLQLSLDSESLEDRIIDLIINCLKNPQETAERLLHSEDKIMHLLELAGENYVQSFSQLMLELPELKSQERNNGIEKLQELKRHLAKNRD